MSLEILEDLRKAIIQYNNELAISSAKKLVEEKIDPIKALDVMTKAIKEVGDGFGRGELWLPDLVGAADAMSAAMPVIDEEIKRTGATRESLGTIVMGTVYGDIHSIGKTMVATLLTAEGFQVYDLGINLSLIHISEPTRPY